MARDRELPPPLEMICLHALWELEEGNVEEVRRLVSVKRPLAYTTVLTLLDRLARRGAVTRRREGRGFRYQPTVERATLCRLALVQFLNLHFEGSAAKLRIFLESTGDVEDAISERPIAENAISERPAGGLSKAAAASGGLEVSLNSDPIA